MAFPRRIEVSQAGKKSLKKLSPHVRVRVLRKLVEYNEKPELVALNINAFIPDRRLSEALQSEFEKMGRDYWHRELISDWYCTG